MDDKDIAFWMSVCLLAVAGTFLITGGCAIRHVRDQAVSAGVAEYYINAEHDKDFRWKTNLTAKP